MAREKRISRLLLGFYATRVRQLQRQIDDLERARTELMAGEAQLERIEVELNQASEELSTRHNELNRGKTELERAGNEQRIGQEEAGNLKIQRDQLVRDETSLEEQRATFTNQTRAFTKLQNMLAQYRGRLDPFVGNAREVQENHLRGGEMLNRNFVLELQAQQDPGKSFVICCSAGVMYLLFASSLVYTFFDYFSSTEGGSPLVDAFYMTFVSTFTIGYGDIVPREVPSKILCDVLVVVGHVVPFIFFHYVDQKAERWDRIITSTVQSKRLRLLCRVLSSIVVILVVIFLGVAGIYSFERDQPVLSPSGPSPSLSPAMAPSPTDVRTQLGFWDMCHLSVMTVTSAGYGDVSFVTVYGRSFAICWIPFSVTIYSVAIAYLTRHTLRAFRVHRYITG